MVWTPDAVGSNAGFEAEYVAMRPTLRPESGDVMHQFDITWFLQAMHKYR
jgi:hypothetical protein